MGGNYVEKTTSYLAITIIKEITDGGVVQLVKLNGDPFPGRVNGSRLKPYTRC